MDKINFEQFDQLMRDMIFLSDCFDWNEEMYEIYSEYKQGTENDPVLWMRECLEGTSPDTHEWYIKCEFIAKTYNEYINENLHRRKDRRLASRAVHGKV